MRKISLLATPLVTTGLVFGFTGLTAAAADQDTETVEAGDSFWSIAQEHDGITAGDLKEINHGLDPYNLQIGTEIMLGYSDDSDDSSEADADTHQVQEGETFYSIAQQYDDVTAEELNNINHGIDPYNIPVGTEILLERIGDSEDSSDVNAATHTVQEGETFYSIAQQYDSVTAEELNNINHGIDPYNIQIGTEILLERVED
ncbi:LysM peptidoglycan-binding domain-containing protein [Alteribacter natronophilus]|uniref:LysM peptidoglycan-binding domain-containing protein n=1 Tax=Alteribacter natronophilus TaxID=2583810 RepID=UPI00110D8EE2|nr:LysM domain-containing protein [Alteribacter natronophilus]TMW71524.1 LysM peptidoglycan-binding domain-containing protein [Alteribacter natronophilus]